MTDFIQSPKYTTIAMLVTATAILTTSLQFSWYIFIPFFPIITKNTPAPPAKPATTITRNNQYTIADAISFDILSLTCATYCPTKRIPLPNRQTNFHIALLKTIKSPFAASEQIAANTVATIAYHHNTTSIASNPTAFALYFFSSPSL